MNSPIKDMSNEERWDFILRELSKGEERMTVIETKIDELHKSTEGVVKAFQSASGAFDTLEWIGKIFKPLMWLFGGTGVLTIIWYEIKRRFGF